MKQWSSTGALVRCCISIDARLAAGPAPGAAKLSLVRVDMCLGPCTSVAGQEEWLPLRP